jgi:hypothetical protein
VIYLYVGLEKLLPQDILVRCARTGNACVEGYYYLPVAAQLFFKTAGEKTFCFYLATL